ncbi:MAG: hypothetical protein EZS28_027887 [Streblomastix strix]|uniref:Uncharacterized protein n=1 Tax=Streblomastix strix TaxID=222440 RepID=A0A5J4V0T1_9EUKA|nr:MAG: hypothetical protein EZS28_027887 [Streblomastix strix]
MVDESTDITSLNEMIIFARYVTNDGVIHSVFIDIIPKDEKGATGQNIYDTFKKAFVNNCLNIKHICSACVDGAAAMIGCRKGMTTLMKQENKSVLPYHCVMHSFNLAQLDTTKEDQLFDLRRCECLCLQLWKYFHNKPRNAAQLAAVHTQDKTKQITLKKQIEIRFGKHQV